MSTSFEHRALVEQLRALTQKRASDDPGTSHPVGDADDSSVGLPTGEHFDENTEALADQDPTGVESADVPTGVDEDVYEGVDLSSPGENAEVEKGYNLGDHNDPGSSHPSAKASAALIKEAKEISQLLRAALKQANVKMPTPTPAVTQSKVAEDEAVQRGLAMATQGITEIRQELQKTAELDAVSFCKTISEVTGNTTFPFSKEAAALRTQVELEDLATKIAEHDCLADALGEPTIEEEVALSELSPEDAAILALIQQQESAGASESAEEGAAIEDMAAEEDVEEAAQDAVEEVEAKEAAFRRRFKKAVAAKLRRKSARRRKWAMEGEEGIVDALTEEAAAEEAAGEGAPSAEEEAAAEEILAEMASSPEGGPAPDEFTGEETGEETGEVPADLSPEEVAILEELMANEGLKSSQVKAFSKVASALSTGRIKKASLSPRDRGLMTAYGTAIQRAFSKFAALRSQVFRNKLNSVRYR